MGDSEPVKIDEAALTGESLAVNKSSGDDILSGAVVEQGESEAVITAVGPNTFFGKTIKLLNRPEEKGHLQQARPFTLESYICFVIWEETVTGCIQQFLTRKYRKCSTLK